MHAGRSAFPIDCAPRGRAHNAAGFNFSLHGAALRITSVEARLTRVNSEFTLDSLIRVLLSVKLAERAGFLLHAATVVRDSRAYVFTGRSGAGKSTIAAMAPAGSALTDEISLLRFAHGGWYAYGTPFWGEFRAAGANRRFPVAGIYSLAQAQENRIEPLSPGQALRALLPNVLFFSRKKHHADALLRALAALVGSVPVGRLHFLRDASFWQVLQP